MQLGEAGATVYVTGRKNSPDAEESKKQGGQLPRLEEVAGEITARGGKGVAVHCDHADQKQVEAVFSRIDKETNGHGVDILVNNAFAGATTVFAESGKPFYELPVELFDEFNNVGLRDHYVCTVLAARQMAKRGGGGGLIVMVGSIGAISYLFTPAYSVGKAGVGLEAVFQT